jgi:hypothetical protein
VVVAGAEEVAVVAVGVVEAEEEEAAVEEAVLRSRR